MYKNQQLFFIGLFGLLSSILVSDFLLIFYNGSYPIYFSFLALIYVIGYLIIVFNDSQLNLKSILYIFIVLKSYFFIVSLFDFDMADKYMNFLCGDANHYHIPSALQITSYNNLLGNLMSPTLEFNGRLTHVLLFFANNSMPTFSHDIYYNISLNAYIVNFVLNFFMLVIVYKTVMAYMCNKFLARKVVLFIALNPFVLFYSGMPQKEALLFCALSMTAYFLVTYRYKYLFLSSIIFLFERPYMILLVLMLIFFSSRIRIQFKLLFISFGFVVLELFLGIERALSMHTHYLIHLKAATESFLPFDNFFGDILRIIFSPFIMRPFLSDYFGMSILYGAYYLMFPLYMYMILKSMVNFAYQNKLILVSLVFIWFVAPFHSTLKITVLTFLGIFFIANLRIFFLQKNQIKYDFYKV